VQFLEGHVLTRELFLVFSSSSSSSCVPLSLPLPFPLLLFLLLLLLIFPREQKRHESRVNKFIIIISESLSDD